MKMESVAGSGFVSSSRDGNLRLWNDENSVSHIIKCKYSSSELC